MTGKFALEGSRSQASFQLVRSISGVLHMLTGRSLPSGG
jgi:hypothetical protein